MKDYFDIVTMILSRLGSITNIPDPRKEADNDFAEYTLNKQYRENKLSMGRVGKRNGREELERI